MLFFAHSGLELLILIYALEFRELRRLLLQFRSSIGGLSRDMAYGVRCMSLSMLECLRCLSLYLRYLGCSLLLSLRNLRSCLMLRLLHRMLCLMSH